MRNNFLPIVFILSISGCTSVPPFHFYPSLLKRGFSSTGEKKICSPLNQKQSEAAYSHLTRKEISYGWKLLKDEHLPSGDRELFFFFSSQEFFSPRKIHFVKSLLRWDSINGFAYEVCYNSGSLKEPFFFKEFPLPALAKKYILREEGDLLEIKMSEEFIKEWARSKNLYLIFYGWKIIGSGIATEKFINEFTRKGIIIEKNPAANSLVLKVF
ncbi:MAG: hypothetical protein KKC11_03905 [Candidatus Omnitrophica bacterium]|nr:hypothetical protein [Candidatus Omnitrophota bacterium]MBU0878386.1 hypothetical protein [Candidatus Omnitrophota bacterium]MBU0897035.1 hypothetical protein [Candidatus Omnitrophota bacterium]MBU1134069.1 hypothetical protein [Candidatus Omnitrophota bacterium]MBU1366762.1 hypothetical protein [Candidatus Omnitrophota bacterium]